MSSETGIEVSYEYIRDDVALAQCCHRWQDCDALALDTEFMRVSTYYPQAALFQVCDRDSITLIDPLRISDWTPFRALLVKPDCIKLLHSCSEDLLVFLREIGVVPAPLFDTQVASSMLEHGLSASYQSLVNHYCGVDLPKGETRSDWLQRPLTDKQLEYAALDVAYLHSIWERQRQQLASLDREAWLEEECGRLQHLYDDEINQDFSTHYLNFKSAWQLAPKQLACLRALASWREGRARHRDKPRSWIIKDPVLFAVARTMPGSKSQLAAIEGVSDNFIRYEGEAVLAIVRDTAALDEAACPPPLPKPFTQGEKNRLKKAKEAVETRAAELELAPEFLVRKRALHALYYALQASAAGRNGSPANGLDTAALPAEFRGWRGPVILDTLIGILR